jgi:hypothetical protein
LWGGAGGSALLASSPDRLPDAGTKLDDRPLDEGPALESTARIAA